MKIILASGSPRRKELLSELLNKYDLEFDIIPSLKSEEELKKMIKEPNQLAKSLSLMKAQDVFNNTEESLEEFVVIGADSLISFENKVLGKPKSEEHAFDMLNELQGKMNKVITGMTVILKKNNKIIIETVATTSCVYMKKMTEQDINLYIQTQEPMDKAGAYAIQGIGKKFVEKYEGDYNTIVGLNTNVIEELLEKYEIITK